MRELIARGRTAEIYTWEPGYVLKLFHNWFELEDIQHEQRIARAVHSNGITTPEAGELVQVEGRTGLIYERLAGLDMFAAMRKQPRRLFDFARRLAGMHAAMHAKPFQGSGLPALRPRLESRIRRAGSLPAGLRGSLLERLARMPEGDRICHGDFHPGNVIVTQQDLLIIDWVDASCGAGLADVARTSIILLGAAAQERNLPVKMVLRLFHNAYLLQYFKLSPGGRDEYRRWRPLVAAARLSEGIPGQEAWLLKQALSGAEAA